MRLMTVTCDVEGNIVIMKFVSIWKSSLMQGTRTFKMPSV